MVEPLERRQLDPDEEQEERNGPGHRVHPGIEDVMHRPPPTPASTTGGGLYNWRVTYRTFRRRTRGPGPATSPSAPNTVTPVLTRRRRHPPMARPTPGPPPQPPISRVAHKREPDVSVWPTSAHLGNVSN